uniref:Uncharacterized protein n=1 Tax=Timema bartmani TaxID=61472 RepID=A0A7R9FCQ8_9NEOP|nr:unnamed protein product [Timema bartmani]
MSNTCFGLLAGSSLPAEEQDTLLSKSLTRKQILRHVGRMSNPVWGKQSRQALLQLKQKFPSSFQDVCLYSEVCHRMSMASYRLVARRFIQELFLDLTFDTLYDEPASILQLENTSVAISSPHNTSQLTSSSTLHSVSVPIGQEVTEVPAGRCSTLVKSPPLEVVKEEAPSLESCTCSVLSVEGVGSSRQSNRSTVGSSEDASKVSPKYNISNHNSSSGVVGDPLCSETTKISSDRSSTDTDILRSSFLIAEDINKNTLESISCRYLNKDQSTSCSNPVSVEPTVGTKQRTLSRAREVNTLELSETNKLKHSSPQPTVKNKHLESLYEFESAINTVVKTKNLELWNTSHSDNTGVGINNVRNMSGDSCVVESDVSKERCVFVDMTGAGDGSSEACNAKVPLLVLTTTAFIAPVFDNTATCVVSNPRSGSSTPKGAPRKDHISPRNRKLATSLPPNISTLAKTSSNLVPTCIASNIAKNVHEIPSESSVQSQTKSGERVHSQK